MRTLLVSLLCFFLLALGACGPFGGDAPDPAPPAPITDAGTSGDATPKILDGGDAHDARPLPGFDAAPDETCEPSTLSQATCYPDGDAGAATSHQAACPFNPGCTLHHDPDVDGANPVFWCCP
jgi:hypothetical protein